MQEQEAPYPTKTELPQEKSTPSKKEQEKNDKETCQPLGLIIPSTTPNPPSNVTRKDAYVEHAAGEEG